MPREASTATSPATPRCCSRALRRPPREIAARLVELLAAAGGLVARVEVAGPGFVNIWLARAALAELLASVLAAGARYGEARRGAGRRVQVEFVSANPTGPLTLGHGRQAVLGDAIASLLDATGHEVTREYYFNNGGRQMRMLGESVKARYLEQLGRAAPPPPEALADPSRLGRIGGLPVVFPRTATRATTSARSPPRCARARRGAGRRAGRRALPRDRRAQIFGEIRKTPRRSASTSTSTPTSATSTRRASIEACSPSSSARVLDEQDGARWLRATACGLERDRVLVKSAGEPTYLLPDIAYHRQKFARGFDS